MMSFYLRLESVPKSSLPALPVNPHPVPTRGPADLPPMSVSKQMQMVPRGSQLYPAQQPDMFYQDPRGAAPPFDPGPYQQGVCARNSPLVFCPPFSSALPSHPGFS